MHAKLRPFALLAFSAMAWLTAPATLPAQPATKSSPETVLFIGNSFIFGAGSAVHYYRAQTVTDLNVEGIGGVPALFKLFVNEAGLDFAVSLETIPGSGFLQHLEKKQDLIIRPWDRVVLLGQSMLDNTKPGSTEMIVRTSKELCALLAAKNPRVDISLIASWSRADQTYPEAGHWHGKAIEVMALDVRAGCDLAAAGTPLIRRIIPVGEAWNRAFKTGVADPNPYDGIAFGQVDLWTYDHYHASNFGYYLEALLVFSELTGLDPRSLGKTERASGDLGFSQPQTAALQQVAYDELMAAKGAPKLKEFTPVKLPR